MSVPLISTFLFFTVAADEAKTISYTSPDPAWFSEDQGVKLLATFDDGIMGDFVKTSGQKEDGGKYTGKFEVEALQKDALAKDMGLVIKSAAHHHGAAAQLSNPFEFSKEESLVVQYEVNFQNGIDCGGAYVKLFADIEGAELTDFNDQTKFSLMFGPDKCAADYKLHLILNHKNPKTGEFAEKHLKTKVDPTKLKELYNSPKTHLYRLVMKSDNSFSISVDGSVISKGNLLSDLDPEINPPAEIEDEEDEKPEDWDDREMIDDESAVKPDDWDEDQPKKIVDANAKMPSDWNEELSPLIDDPEALIPEDWDEEMDGEYEPPQIENPECADISGCGEWEAPMIANPLHKGKWRAPKIKNPNYQGIWKPRMIANPDYFEDTTPFANIVPIRAMALELWTMSSDIYFDNFIIANNEAVADQLKKATFDLKVKQAKANEPSLLEKTKEGLNNTNPKILYTVIAAIALPLLYLLYSKLFASKPDPAAEHKKDDDAQIPEDQVPESGSEIDADEANTANESEKAAESEKEPEKEASPENSATEPEEAEIESDSPVVVDQENKEAGTGDAPVQEKTTASSQSEDSESEGSDSSDDMPAADSLRKRKTARARAD